VLEEEVLVKAGTNISLGCPGMDSSTPATVIEWRCRGQCGSSTKKPPTSKEKTVIKLTDSRQTKAAEYGERVSIDTEMHSLVFSPVRSDDIGSYTCWVNRRIQGAAAVRLHILGECVYFY